jgi:hypothetical protein
MIMLGFSVLRVSWNFYGVFAEISCPSIECDV